MSEILYLKNYRNLISVILTYPNQATKVLNANQELQNSTLVQTMEKVATQMAANGSKEAANFLQELATQIKQTITTTEAKAHLQFTDYSQEINSNQSIGLKLLQNAKIVFLLGCLIFIVTSYKKNILSFPSVDKLSNQNSLEHTAQNLPAIKTVTALGRLEPQGKVVKLSAPVYGEGSRVDQILVQEGSSVSKGQIIAVLNNRDRWEAILKQNSKQVEVAKAKLAQVLAGAKSGEIEAARSKIARLEAERVGDLNTQTANITRLAAEVENAQMEYDRYQFLYQQGAISASQKDTKQLILKTAQKNFQAAKAVLERTKNSRQYQIDEAYATLAKIQEVRPVDVQLAEAEVQQALSAVEIAQANLEQVYVRSPQNGQVLKINTHSGELINSEGIVEIGQIDKMLAVAEVYESDVQKIKVGQTARITSDALNGELSGTVEQIGYQVLRQNLVNTDPSANIDARIVEVKIKLDSASIAKAAKFTNLQVMVEIKI